MLRLWNDWRARRLLKKCNDRYLAHDCKGAAALAARAARAASSVDIRRWAMVLRADYILHDGDETEAIRLFKEAVDSGAESISLVHKKLAKLLISHRDFEGAIENCMKSLSVDGPAHDTYGLLGDAHYQLGHIGLAQHWFEKTVAEDPTDSYAAEMLQKLSGESQEMKDTGNEMEPILGRILPSDGRVLLARGALDDGLMGGGGGDQDKMKQALDLIHEQDFDRAEVLLRAVCARCPEHYDAEFLSGDVMHVRCWDFGEFMTYAGVRRHADREVIWLSSVYPRAFYYMGEICSARGDCQSAIQWLEKGHALEPNSARFLNQSARRMPT